MGYNLINWENSPSKQTPINAENLNQMDVNIAKAIQGTRFNFSATFTSDGVLKNTRQTDVLGAGDFATGQNDIGAAYVSNAVTKIGSGTFSNCTSLKTIYIDNTVENVEIVSGAIPDGVSIVYSNDDNFINVNELLASAIKSLKSSINTNRTDWENRATSIETQHKTDVQTLNANISQVADNLQIVKETAQREIATTNTNVNGKESLSNKVDVITHPSTTTYPSVKGVWDFVETKSEQPRADIAQNKADIAILKANKVDNTDFNAYKTSNNTAVKQNATDIVQLKADVLQNAIKATTDKSTSIVLNDSSDCNIVGLTLYGKSTQSAVPSPTNPVDINSVENPSITFSNKKSSQNLQLNYILRGVDNICDVLTINSDGTGFITEKLQQLVLLSSDFDNLKENPSGTNTHRCTLTLSNSTQWANSSVKYAPLCNVLQFFAFAGTEKYPCFDIRTNTLYVDLGLSLNETKATLKNCADENNGIVLVGVKQTPTVLNLTNEQINGFLNLHMYYPSTTVVSDCDSQLTYIADTKNYIDNKFNELATALVAHESEVM